MNRFFDVAIIGGGPAGTATALSLREHAPSLSVVLIEGSRSQTIRIGETLPPPARAILDHLGVWRAYCAQGHREVHGARTAWGIPAALDNDFIYMFESIGWHVDRAAFDSMLVSEAERRGTTLIRETGLRHADRAGEQWRLTLSNQSPVRARFVVDATGGRAAFARRAGARFVSADRLVGIARIFRDSSDDPRLLVESFEDGWWYTAGFPGGARIAVCMTDSDLAHRLKLGDIHQWTRTLAATSNVAAMLQKSIPSSPLLARGAASRRLEPAAGENWLAVGDASSRFDPLSSQGIAKALRSGIFASYAIGDLLTRNDDRGLNRYRHYVLEEFKSYMKVRTHYYRQEQRWPESDFWRRRHEALPSVERSLSWR